MDGVGLSGQRRLVDLEHVGLQQPAVCRDQISGPEHDHVPGDHLVQGNLPLGPVTPYVSMHPHRRQQVAHRVDGAALLQESQ